MVGRNDVLVWPLTMAVLLCRLIAPAPTTSVKTNTVEKRLPVAVRAEITPNKGERGRVENGMWSALCTRRAWPDWHAVATADKHQTATTSQATAEVKESESEFYSSGG